MSVKNATERTVAENVPPERTKAPADDADFEPINFHEAFRRAKRNSLVWSSLTILATMGSSADNDGNSVSLFQVGLHYEQWKIVVACFVTAVFMVAGYYRAERLLPLLNSTAFRHRKLAQYTRVVEDLADQAKEACELFNAAVRNLLIAEERISSLAKFAEEKIEETESALKRASAAAASESFFAMENAQNPTAETYRGRLAKVQNALIDLDARLRQTMATKEDGRVLAERPGVQASQLANLEEKLVDPITELQKSANLFAAYDQAIGRGEKGWFLLHDRLPVYGAFAIATGLAIWRLWALGT